MRRRSLPLRAADMDHLITYDNDIFEPQLEPKHLMDHLSCSISGISSASPQSQITALDNDDGISDSDVTVDFQHRYTRNPGNFLLKRNRHGKVGTSYPVFTGGFAVQSPRSPLSVYSFREEADSTSYNFSEDAQPSTCSSSSCITSASLEGPFSGSTGSGSSNTEQCTNNVSTLSQVIQTSSVGCSDGSSVHSQMKSSQIVTSSPSYELNDQTEATICTESSLGTCLFLHDQEHQRSSSLSPCRSLCESSNSCYLSKNSSSTTSRSRKGFRVPRFQSPLRFLTTCLLVGSPTTEDEERRRSGKKFHSKKGFPDNGMLSSPISSSKTQPSKDKSLNNDLYELQRNGNHFFHRNKSVGDQSKSPRAQFLGVNGLTSDLKMHSASLKCTPGFDDLVTHNGEVSQSSSTCFQEPCQSTAYLKEVMRRDSFHYDSDSVLFQREGPRSKICGNHFLTRHVAPYQSASVRSNRSCNKEEKCDKVFLSLRHEIRRLRKEKRDLALDLVSEIKARFSEREAAEFELKSIESEMENKVISVEKDNANARACIERELDCRKKEWAARLEKIKAEETRLRQRVVQMAEDNVKLQKEVASYRSKESSWKSQTEEYETSLKTWMERVRKSEEETMELKQSFADVCNKLSNKQEELDVVVQQSRVLKMENAELLKEFSRLRRASLEQEITFEELWQSLVEFINGPAEFKAQNISKLHRELIRLAVREQALINEISLLRTELADVKPHRCQNGDNQISLSKRQLSVSTPLTTQSQEHEINQDNLQLQEDGLKVKLCHGSDRVKELEQRLVERDEKIKLLNHTLQKNDWEIKELHSELTWARMERDEFRKQAEEKTQESLKLTLELSELKKVAEKLDDELMLKEGQISILREAYSDGDF